MDFQNTLMASLGIKLVSANNDLVIMTMPVDQRTHQPAGFLHGGANVALAETAASIGAQLHVDQKTKHIFGMEINANHLKSKTSGNVTAKARPLHIGRSSMVWEIHITDETGQRLCISRCTIGIVPKKKAPDKLN